eukprot:1868584-Prymnesium_polylepis.1
MSLSPGRNSICQSDAGGSFPHRSPGSATSCSRKRGEPCRASCSGPTRPCRLPTAPSSRGATHQGAPSRPPTQTQTPSEARRSSRS